MSSGKVLLGVLAGFAAGAALGILFAPDKGSETRKKIADKSDDYVEGLKKKFNEFLEDVVEKYDSTTKTAKEEVKQEAAE